LVSPRRVNWYSFDMNEEIRKRIETFQQVLKEVPELTYAGNPVLRQKTEEVSVTEGVELAKHMEDVLLRYRAITGAGRGLAAPQVGENKAVFITYENDKVEVFFNPKIVQKSEVTNFYKELCMSGSSRG